MKTTIFYLFFFIFGAFNCLTQGQFKIRNDEFIQIGYTGYKALTFGQGTGSPNNGAFALEYCSGCTVAGLNFWKPWPTSNAANYLSEIMETLELVIVEVQQINYGLVVT